MHMHAIGVYYYYYILFHEGIELVQIHLLFLHSKPGPQTYSSYVCGVAGI